MSLFELLLATAAAGLNYRIARNNRLLWLGLTLWTTLSLSSPVAEALGLYAWLPAVHWVRALGIFWFGLSFPILLSRYLRSRTRLTADPGRRAFLHAGAAAALTPAAGVAFAIHRARQEAAVTEVTVPIPNLPPDLEGLRLVQLSDIHLGDFFSLRQLRRVVDQANELRPDVAFITGDLITSYGDPLAESIHELSRLRAVAGIYGCLGNHEIVAEAEDLAERLGARAGIQFLRSRARRLRFGNSTINVAGVDYQRKGSVYLPTAAALHAPGNLNLLLSHNPDVFPVAAQQQWDLTLAGHTHGGQVNLEFLHPSVNPARFYTPFTYGYYRRYQSAMFVTSGLGTVGVPARIGTAPEIALLRLQAERPSGSDKLSLRRFSPPTNRRT